MHVLALITNCWPWDWTHRFLHLSYLAALFVIARLHRLWHDGPNGIEQHGFTNHRRTLKENDTSE